MASTEFNKQKDERGFLPNACPRHASCLGLFLTRQELSHGWRPVTLDVGAGRRTTISFALANAGLYFCCPGIRMVTTPD
ncbi:MAG: hypothetical protein ACFCU4_06235 [Puniceicoccaceae bacterium]